MEFNGVSGGPDALRGVVGTKGEPVGQGARLAGRLQVFRPSRSLEENVGDPEVVDPPRD
jgi:hypothetical protein